jgi:hypothetical protein
MPGMQLREGRVDWVADLAGSTSSTVYPSGATAGVTPPNPGRSASRLHVFVDYTVASGTMSLNVSLYGYTGGSATPATPAWVYLGALNGGSSITANTSTWSQSATRITLAEVFSVSGENFSRYATRSVPGGTSPVVSTWVGFVGD